MTIWLAAAGAPGGLDTVVDGISATDDGPDEGGEAVDGDETLPPPHAVSAAASRIDEMTCALGFMVLLPCCAATPVVGDVDFFYDGGTNPR
jgi:hypothetical protein